MTWIVIVAFFRMSSLAALVAALFAPCYAGWLFGLRSIAVSASWKSRLLNLCADAENNRRLGAGTSAIRREGG